MFKGWIGWVLGASPIDYSITVLGLWGEYPPWGVFLRDPRPYLREFWGKPWKKSERLGRQARTG